MNNLFQPQGGYNDKWHVRFNRFLLLNSFEMNQFGLSGATMKYMQCMKPDATANENDKKAFKRLAENLPDKAIVVQKLDCLPPEEKRSTAQPIIIKNLLKLPQPGGIGEKMQVSLEHELVHNQISLIGNIVTSHYEKSARKDVDEEHDFPYLSTEWINAEPDEILTLNFTCSKTGGLNQKEQTTRGQHAIFPSTSEHFLKSSNLFNSSNSEFGDRRVSSLAMGNANKAGECDLISNQNKKYSLELSYQNASNESLELPTLSCKLGNQYTSYEFFKSGKVLDRKFTTKYLFDGTSSAVLKNQPEEKYEEVELYIARVEKETAGAELMTVDKSGISDIESEFEKTGRFTINTAYSLALKTPKHLANKFCNLIIPQDWTSALLDAATLNLMEPSLDQLHDRLPRNCEVFIGSQAQEICADKELDCDDIQGSLDDMDKSFSQQNNSILSSTPKRDRSMDHWTSPEKLSPGKKLSQQNDRLEKTDDASEYSEMLETSHINLTNLSQQYNRTCSDSESIRNFQFLPNNVPFNDSNLENDDMFSQIVDQSIVNEPDFRGFNRDEMESAKIVKEIVDSQKLEDIDTLSQLNPM